MKKIAVITTGGTIGSVLQQGAVSVDTSGQRIISEITSVQDKQGRAISITSPLNKNSEDFSPVDWCKLLHSLQKADHSNAIGTVITHGTDTLAYSVAAALVYRNIWKKKICFTGSYYALDHATSDASLNLITALEFISQPKPENGVFVVFRMDKSNHQVAIIDGASLCPMSFDEQSFRVAYHDSMAIFNPAVQTIHLKEYHTPCLGVQNLPVSDNVETMQSRVACVALYPGIDRQILECSIINRDILIIQLYHSGTGATNKMGDLLEFIENNCAMTKICMATFPRQHIDIPYASTKKLKSSGAHIYFDLQVHFLYVFSVLGLSVGLTPDTIIEKLVEFEI